MVFGILWILLKPKSVQVTLTLTSFGTSHPIQIESQQWAICPFYHGPSLIPALLLPLPLLALATLTSSLFLDPIQVCSAAKYLHSQSFLSRKFFLQVSTSFLPSLFREASWTTLFKITTLVSPLDPDTHCPTPSPALFFIMALISIEYDKVFIYLLVHWLIFPLEYKLSKGKILFVFFTVVSSMSTTVSSHGQH